MKLETQRLEILTVVDRWRKRHGGAAIGDDRLRVLNELERLDLEKCSAEDVNRIIGNDSWTRVNPCHECGADSVHTVMLGQEPEYESYTAWICKECMNKAIALIESVE